MRQKNHSPPAPDYKLLSKHRACFSYPESAGYTTKYQTWETNIIYKLKHKQKHLHVIQTGFLPVTYNALVTLVQLSIVFIILTFFFLELIRSLHSVNNFLVNRGRILQTLCISLALGTMLDSYQMVRKYWNNQFILPKF